MNISKLMEIGLTKREADAYLALLKLEEAKAGDVAEHTKEDRTNIYDSLRSLVKKGLVTRVIKNNMVYYRICSPEKLRDYIKEKERTIEEILPDILNIYKSFKPKPVIEVHEGKEGIKTVFNDILRENNDFVTIGATNMASKLLPEFTKIYLKEREIRKISARQIYPSGGKLLPSKLSLNKSIPAQYLGPTTTIIYGDKVAIFMWFIEPLVTVLIKNKGAAKAYKNQFEFMWKIIK